MGRHADSLAIENPLCHGNIGSMAEGSVFLGCPQFLMVILQVVVRVINISQQVLVIVSVFILMVVPLVIGCLSP